MKKLNNNKHLKVEKEVGKIVCCPMSDNVRLITDYDDDGMPVTRELSPEELNFFQNQGEKGRCSHKKLKTVFHSF